jgi:hypothetical protein
MDASGAFFTQQCLRDLRVCGKVCNLSRTIHILHELMYVIFVTLCSFMYVICLLAFAISGFILERITL